MVVSSISRLFVIMFWLNSVSGWLCLISMVSLKSERMLFVSVLIVGGLESSLMFRISVSSGISEVMMFMLVVEVVVVVKYVRFWNSIMFSKVSIRILFR